MNEVRTGEGGGSSWNLFSEWLNSLPFPDSRWGRREQMDTGRRGRRAWNEGDGRGTDGIGGKLREESGRMGGKFSIWPWAEMKICMYLGAARYCFGMHHFFPQWHLLLKVLRAEPAVQEIHRTVPYIFLRRQLLQVGISAVFKPPWQWQRRNECKPSAQSGLGSGSLPGIPASPGIGAYDFEEVSCTLFAARWPKYSKWFMILFA